MPDRFKLKAREWIHQPDTKRDFNRALFTEVSSKYGFVTQALSWGRDRTWKETLVGQLPELPGSRPKCLDLACGTGDVTFSLARRFPAGQIVGLDLCAAMLELARQQNVYGHVSFLLGDMCQTGFEPESVDLVTGAYALRNAPCLNGVLTEIRRVLRPGGTAAFLEFSKPPHKLLQQFEHVSLLIWGALWGYALHRNPEVYAYIAKSLQQYPDRAMLERLLRVHGFIHIRSQTFFWGAIAITMFEKPAGKPLPL